VVESAVAVIPQPVCITIEGIPPSVNHYKEPRGKRRDRNGVMRPRYALSPEAILFRDLVWIAAAGRSIAPESKRDRNLVRYALTVTVYFSKFQRGDGDNFWKCIGDALETAGVIHSDARVRRWLLEVEDEERDNPPRTEIRAEVLKFVGRPT
jgi:hypothetical protein